MVGVLSSSIIILFLFIYIQDVFSILVPWSVSCHLVLLYYFYLFTYRMFFSIPGTMIGVLSSSIIILFLFIYIQDVFLYPGTMVRVLSSSIIILFLFIYIQDVFLYPGTMVGVLSSSIIILFLFIYIQNVFLYPCDHGRCPVI